MRRLFVCLVTTAGLAGLLAAVQLPEPCRDNAAAAMNAIGAIQPRVSPDGQTMAVSYQEALWTLPRAGGAMTRLTSDPGFDIESTGTPDGKRIAFVNSPRFGRADRRIITRDGTDVPLKKRIEVLGTVLYQKLEWLDDDRIPGTLRVDGQLLGYGQVNLSAGEAKALTPASS